uniref:Uncharacterized protein n=1 Tax=Onchocerca volvulus TaxID=6282 RepID=A0A8R1TKK5_ONCVO
MDEIVSRWTNDFTCRSNVCEGRNDTTSIKISNRTALHFACARASKCGIRMTQILLERWKEDRLAENLQKCLSIH